MNKRRSKETRHNRRNVSGFLRESRLEANAGGEPLAPDACEPTYEPRKLKLKPRRLEE